MQRSGVVRTRIAVGTAAILIALCAYGAPIVAERLQPHAAATSWSWVLSGVLFLVLLSAGGVLRRAARKDRDPLRRLKQVGRLIAAAPVDITVRDKSLRMVASSAGMQRFVDITVRNGWVRPEFIDLEFLSRDEKDQLPMPASVAALVREYQTAMATGAARSYDFYNEVETVGIKAPYGGRVTPLFGVHGEVIGMISKGMYFLGHSQSLDDSAAARGRAERVNDTKTRFLAAVSRDVRNPLNAMAGLLEMALCDAATPRQSKEMLATVRSSAQSLLQLLPSIVDIRGMETGDLPCTSAPISLRRVAADVVALFAPSAYEKGISLTLEVAPEVAACHLTDAKGVSQLLNNFLSNAIRYTARGGVRIHLDGAPLEDGLQWVTLSVIDTGSGIEPYIQQKLSESRYEAGLSASPDGAGLGLHYCQQMVHRIGGTIRISSAVGEGTHVHVRVPLALGPSPSSDVAQDTAPGLAPRPAAGLRTLVVESEAGNRLLLKSQLEFLGHEVLVADHGAQGVALARDSRLDLVVCDDVLQDMDGAGFIQMLRAGSGESAAVPVLGYTAGARAEDREAGLRAGMHEVLVKPAGLRELEQALASCLPAACARGGLARDGAA
ncbi:His Kinase A phosphoacceptor domain protein 12 [Achromobacter xylosoxidans A8]|uniref:histidine kinase n=2 Tax=Alcaligenes xylosoxydans xylosoxydans TaxID=85698 RepID=E3HKN2_ACHXA|nr:His Kinase A phosphoacceptor domain protein 12 [Achromobacter xylosoxidans A8]